MPTVHANWRYFEMYDGKGSVVKRWFGGGADLTPYYLVEEDAVHFHQVMKNMCDKHNTDYYTEFKKACDKYFSIATETKLVELVASSMTIYKKTKTCLGKVLAFQMDAETAFWMLMFPSLKSTKKKRIPKNKILARGPTWALRRVQFTARQRNTFRHQNQRKNRVNFNESSFYRSMGLRFPNGKNSEEAKLIEVLMNPREWV